MQKGLNNGSLSKLGPHKIADFVGKDKSLIFLSEGTRKIRLSLTVATLVVIFDQLSKLWIRNNLAPLESLPEVGFLRLTHVLNTGSAFGLLANQTFLLIIATISSLIIILLFLHYLPSAATLSIISASLILGGAIGNLVDRLRFGYVTDFIDIRFWGNFHWPAFNIADAAITIGIFVFIYSLYRSGLFRKVYDHNRRAKN
jgi:signal peptidase II